MTVKSLNEALHEAYVHARDMDASLGERLQTFADAVRRLGPHFQEAVDKLVARLKEQGVGETAPKRRRCRTTCGVTPNRAAISSAPKPRSSANFLKASN